MSHYEDLNTTKIALVGFISMVIVFVVVLLMMVLFHWAVANVADSTAKDRQIASEFEMLTAEQKGKLADYRWIDPEKKIVQIPIKQAMDLVLEDLQKPPQEKPLQQKPPADAPAEKEGDHAS